MNNEEKKALFPFFAYQFSQKMNPEKYGATSSIEEWSQLLQENEADANTIIAEAEKLTDEDWNELNKQYSEQQANEKLEEVQYAAKGAKLKKLSSMKSKKCKCGCSMITTKEEGGKLSMKCSCGCGIKKNQEGGEIASIGKTAPNLDKIKKASNLKPALKKLPPKTKNN